MSEPTQPPSCFSSGCPLAGVAKGFVLGSGSPSKARYGACLEAAGRDEIVFELKPNANRQFLSTAEACEKELAERRAAYPNLDEKWLKVGAPIVGATGGALTWWILPKVGLRREDFFVDNVLRCLPPKSKSGGQYPTGETRKQAERCCRQYDRWEEFNPNTVVLTIHPSSLLREITPLPLLIKDVERVRDFTSQGRRVLLLLGGKAAHAFLQYAENSVRWRGHYAALAANWSHTYKSLFEYAKKARVKRVKKAADSIESDYFGVPRTVLERARKKVERPAELVAGECKAAKRHTHRRPPKCGYATCWDKFEEARNGKT